MAIIFWWLLPIWAVVIAGLVWFYFRRQKKHSQTKRAEVPIAHSGRITQLAAYKTAYTRYRNGLLGLLGLAVLGGLTAILLSARPATQDLVAPQQKNRDIMLCLDVSGSMSEVNEGIFSTFTKLVDNFDGQRIGLTTFNSNAVTIFPLTDDYVMIDEYMQKGTQAFKLAAENRAGSYTDEEYDTITLFRDGTTGESERGSSIIGDGLASCVNRMGENQAARPQSIILATDNELGGTSIFSFTEAAVYAKSKNIRVYTLDPGASDSFDSTATAHAELKQATELTGGQYSRTTDTSIQRIVDDISKQEAKLYSSSYELVQRDTPAIPIVIAFIVLAGLFIIVWRLRL